MVGNTCGGVAAAEEEEEEEGSVAGRTGGGCYVLGHQHAPAAHY